MKAAKAVAVLLMAVACLVTAPAQAEKIWKYDDGPDDLGTLAGSKMHPQFAHPGFVSQEAFGALFKPEAGTYPITITGVDVLMAAPQTESNPASKKVNATIEIWNATNDGPKPDAEKPHWTVHTSDFFNPQTQKPGTPIQGNTVMQFNFSSNKKGDKPPPIEKGNIWIMVRLTSNTSDYSLSYWSKLDCFKGSVAGIEACGCQDLAALTDSATTKKTQVMNIVWPLGKCSGNKAWKFVEDLTNQSGFTMTGDFRLRMRTAGGGGSSSGGSSSGGSSSSSGGSVDAGSTEPEDTYVPPMKPLLNKIVPAEGKEGESTDVTIIGSGFMSGASVQVGGKSAEVLKVTETTIDAKVLAGLAPGSHDVAVENPNKQAGSLEKAFTVVKKAAPQVDAGTDSGAGMFIPGGKMTIDIVSPTTLSCTEDTELTVIGTGFAQGMTLEVGGRPVQGVSVVSDTKVTGLVSKGLSAGKHSLIAKNGGNSAVKANAISVTCDDGGCSTSTGTHDSKPNAPLFLVLAGLVALLARRQTA